MSMLCCQHSSDLAHWSKLQQYCLWQTKAALPLTLSFGTTTNLLCKVFNSTIILSLSPSVFLLFSVVSLVARWLIFELISDITACFYSENDVITPTAWKVSIYGDFSRSYFPVFNPKKLLIWTLFTQDTYYTKTESMTLFQLLCFP